MRLQGSCHCGAVSFQCESKHPYPYQLCYCTVCRKTAGAGGYAINLAGEAASLQIVRGQDNISTYQARIQNPEDPSPRVSTARRNFCKTCGSMLWLFDPTWPELVHPFASAIDSDLPTPPEQTHIMLEFKASWAEPQFGPKDKKFDRYPDESIEDWHKRLGLEC